MDVSWIDDAEALARFCEGIEPDGSLALDTESDHFIGYHPCVALIQIATPHAAALVDPLALETEEMEPLFEVLEDARVTKLAHSSRNEIGELDRDFGLDMVNVFDTQIAARFLGYEKFNLAHLLEELLGVTVSKRYQRFDWLRRPLPEGALEYAAGDVVHLFALRERFAPELEERGWREAFEQQCAYVAATSLYEETGFDDQRWRKLDGADKLDDRGRATLQALYVWRHELCDRINRAALHVFTNQALVKVAKRRPTTLDELAEIRGIKDETLRRNGEAILAVIRNAAHREPPPLEPPGGPRPSRAETMRLKKLSKLRRALGEEIALPLDLIMNREAMEYLARHAPQERAGLDEVPTLLRWQRERFGDEILGALASR